MDIVPVLGRTADLPPGYAEQLATIKRFLELWTIDRSLQGRYRQDTQAAIAETGLPLTPEILAPFVVDEVARAFHEDLREGREHSWPLPVRRYKAFYREKRRHREQIRREAQPADPRMAAWRARQMNRCVGTLGRAKATALVHAPAAFELARAARWAAGSADWPPPACSPPGPGRPRMPRSGAGP